jgi:hypothetical protein
MAATRFSGLVTRIRALAALAVLAIAAGAGCSDEGGAAPAATVNGVDITAQDVVDELEAIRGNEAFLAQREAALAAQGGGAVLGAEDDTFDSAFVAQTLTTRILFAIVATEVDERGIEVDDDCLAAAEDEQAQQLTTADDDGQAILDAFDDDYHTYLVTRFAELVALQGDLAGFPCTVLDDDAALEQYFDEHIDQFTQKCVTVVQFATPQAADDFSAQLDAGGDFDALAGALAPEVGSSTDVGCDSTEELLGVVPALAELDAGDVSPVVLVGETAVIIRVDDVVEPDFEAQRNAVVDAIGTEIDTAFSAWLEDELRSADVRVDPRYGTWNPNIGSQQLPQIDRPLPDATEPEADADADAPLDPEG